MKNSVTKIHSGMTSKLPTPLEVGNERFSFRFQAVTPVQKRWAYRLLPSMDPSHITEERLLQLLREKRPVLRADWEEQVGHPIGFITIYIPRKDGGTEAKQARFERGPEMEMEMEMNLNRPDVPEVPAPQVPAPPEMDLSF